MNGDERPACYIHQIATAVPERHLPTEGFADLMQGTCSTPRSAKLLRRIAGLTGIHKRHLAILDSQSSFEEPDALYRTAVIQPHGPGMGARTLAFTQASDRLVRRLLDAFSRQSLAEVSTLVTLSCTHASSPGLERPIFRHSAVPTSADRWNLGFMGCSASLAAIRLVYHLADKKKAALIVACELSSLQYQYTDRPDQMAANLLFSDGAAGVLVSRRRSPVRVLDCRCAALPAYADQMVWSAGDNGLELVLSPELADTLAAYLPATVAEFLSANGVAHSDVAHWVVHPGGPQILDAVEGSLGLAADALSASRWVLREYGNMSSPTVLFVLKKLLEAGARGLAVAMAFGPGLTIELVLLRLSWENATG